MKLLGFSPVSLPEGMQIRKPDEKRERTRLTSDLFRCVENNAHQQLNQLLLQNPKALQDTVDPETGHSLLYTALYAALLKSDFSRAFVETIATFIRHGANLALARPDSHADNILHLIAKQASASPALSMILGLLKRDGRLKDFSQSYNSLAQLPLTAAIETGELRNVSFLLSEGIAADPPAGETGATPMYHAIRRGSSQMVACLLAAGADPDRPYSYSSLMVLLEQNMPSDERRKIFELLIHAGINPCYSSPPWDKTLLQAAAALNESYYLKKLLPFYPDINHPDYYGNTALLAAAATGCLENVKLLMEAGADPTQVPHEGEMKGKTIFHMAAKNPDVNILKYLLAQNVDPKLMNRFGPSPLWEAVKAGYVEAVKILLPYCNAKEIDQSKRTLLHLALNAADSRIPRMLLQAGADPDQTDHFQETPLAYWIPYGHHDLSFMHISSLLDAGANPNLPDRNNCTPLQVALRKVGYLNSPDTKKMLQMIQLLLVYGADPSVQDSAGLNTMAWVSRHLEKSSFRKELLDILEKAA